MKAMILLLLLGAVPPMEQAVLDATKDAQSLDHPELARYIYLSGGSVEDVADVEFAANTALSRDTGGLVSVTQVTKNLVRLELDKFDPKLTELPKLWDLISEKDPYFTVPGAVVIVERREPCAPYKAGDGKTYDYKIVKVEIRERELLVDSNLQELTDANVPIIENRFFYHRVLSTIDGGLYYQVRGIERSTQQGLTDEDVFLKKFAGVTLADVEKLESEQKYAVFFSGVTGKQRVVLVMRGISSKPGVNQNLVMITLDVRDRDIDAVHQPIRNLLSFKHEASEIIIEMANGCHVFGIFNGSGQRVDEVPPDVAADANIPNPHSKRLVPAISCIRCHMKEEGVLTVENDVHKLLNGRFKLNVFGEARDGFPKRETISRLAGLYGGSLTKPFERARADYSDVAKIIGSRHKIGDKLTIAGLHAHLCKEYEQYRYGRVNAKIALEELGIPTEKDHASVLFQRLKLIPPDELGILAEDPVIGALQNDLSVSRFEWEQVYADAYLRLVRNPAAVVGAGK